MCSVFVFVDEISFTSVKFAFKIIIACAKCSSYLKFNITLQLKEIF